MTGSCFDGKLAARCRILQTNSRDLWNNGEQRQMTCGVLCWFCIVKNKYWTPCRELKNRAWHGFHYHTPSFLTKSGRWEATTASQHTKRLSLEMHKMYQKSSASFDLSPLRTAFVPSFQASFLSGEEDDIPRSAIWWLRNLIDFWAHSHTYVFSVILIIF